MKINKEGIYNYISIEDYHADKSWLSASILKKAKKSLKDFWLVMQGYYDNQERKQHLDFGNACEMALLSPEDFEKSVAIFDIREKPEPEKTFASTKNKAWKDSFYEENKDKYIINYDGNESFRVIEEILKSCYSDYAIQKVIKNVEYQKSIYWTDPITGLKLKTRPDIVRTKHNLIIDVKTAQYGNPEAFSKSLAN